MQFSRYVRLHTRPFSVLDGPLRRFSHDSYAIRRHYEKSGLKQMHADSYAEQLDDYMISKKPYLDPDLRIEDIAKALGIKRHHLTQMINKFSIRDAQKMMSDKKNTEMSILRIAYETGFNSKAPFNRIFKIVTGQTPTEYRNRM